MDVGEARARFIVDDSQWQTGLIRVEGTVQRTGQVVATELAGVQTSFQQTGSSVATTTQQMNDAVEKLSLSDRLQAGVDAFNQVADAVRGVATELDAAAGRADDLSDRLTATFKDRTDQMVALARDGLRLGFSDEDLGSALQALDKFGVATQQNLALLQDAARGANENIVGLADSFGRFQEFGDAKSLLALQKSLGASNDELERFGAKIDESTGKISLLGPNLELAKDAVNSFIQANYAGAADAAADASTRLTGELELLKAEIGSAAFGLKEGLAPAGLAAVQAMRGLPEPLKGAVGLGVQFVGMGASAGSAALQMGANLAILTSNTTLMNNAMLLTLKGVGGLRTVLLATLSPLGLAVAAIGGLALAVHSYNEELEAAAKAGGELAKADADRLKGYHAQKDLVGKTAEEIQKMGKTSQDVTAVLAGLREQAQLAQDQGNSAQVAKLRQQIGETKQVRNELLELERKQKEAEANAPSAKDKKKADKDAEKAGAQIAKEFLQAEKEANSQAEKARKESLDARLDGIRAQAAAGELSKQQQIAAYQEVLKTAQLTVSEERNLVQQIAQLKGQIRSEQAAAEKQAEQKRTQEAAKSARERVQAEKQAEAEAKREAEAQARQQKQDTTQLQQLAKEKATLETQALNEQINELEKGLGKNPQALQAITNLLERRGQLIVQQIRAERDAALESTKNEQIRSAITENAEVKIRAAKAETTKQIKAEADKQNQVLKDQVQATQTAVAQIDQITSRVGGKNSPLYSDVTEGLGISLGNFQFTDLKKPASSARPVSSQAPAVVPVPVPSTVPDVKYAQAQAQTQAAQPVEITVQVLTPGQPTETKKFAGTAQELARQTNKFNANHRLGQI